MLNDAVILGGSFAGLSAALQLARARRSVVVIDAGQRRNRFAATSHGFLGQDGSSPDAIVAAARSQLLAYPTVTLINGTAERKERQADGFRIEIRSSAAVSCRKLILATGVADRLPVIPGLQERWGKSVFHCPYCHGYELNKGRIAVLAVNAVSMHQALMLPDWGPTTLFTNGQFSPDADQLIELAGRGVTLEETPIDRLSDGPEDTIILHLRDGRAEVFAGSFVAPHTEMAAPFADDLGCAFEEGPIGRFIATDAMKATSVAGVFACGDAARMAGNVASAVADGAMAGIALHRSLMFPAH